MPKNKVYSKEIKGKARRLRQHGWSFGEISLKMGIPKNTLSGWVRGIRLTTKQIKRLKQKEIACAAKARILSTKAWRTKIETWKKAIRQKVRYFEDVVQNPKIGKLICGILYLCEGSKYPASRMMVFSNSDPKIIRAFLNLLRKHFHICEYKLRCRIMARWDQDMDKLQHFWSDVTEIPLKHFYRTTPDKRTKGRITKKKGYKGVCAIYYCNTSLQFELISIGEEIINGAFTSWFELISEALPFLVILSSINCLHKTKSFQAGVKRSAEPTFRYGESFANLLLAHSLYLFWLGGVLNYSFGAYSNLKCPICLGSTTEKL